MVRVASRVRQNRQAEPISALYEAGRVFHAGDGFPELEEQMTSYTPGATSFARAAPANDSSNNADARVGSIAELK